MTIERIVIVGAGECGVRAAFALREKDFGGAITLIGAESSLPYERPPLSKKMDGEAKLIRPRDAYESARIDLRLGETVSRLDPGKRKVELSRGETLGYDKLLLATGARARLFSGMESCQTLRTDNDARAIMARIERDAHVGIIGGGFIGLELAATARQAGADVTVIEAAPRLLGRAVPEDIAAHVHGRHIAEGIRIKTGIGVTSADAQSITLADGTRLEFHAVIAGVGAVPNAELAEAAGLTVDNGIVVDGKFRTSASDIHAAGDCCNFVWNGARVRLESWRAAQEQGAHAAAAMLGSEEPYGKVPWFWSDQYDMTLQVAGLFDFGLDIHRREPGDESLIVFQCEADGTLGATAGIGPGNTVAKDIRILEKLIERRAKVDPADLADPSFNLKRLLKAA